MGAVDDGLDDRAGGFRAAHAQDTGGQRQQQEHARHGKESQQREQVGLGIGAADQDQPGAGASEHDRDEQHQSDAAAVAAAAGTVDRQAGAPRLGTVRRAMSAVRSNCAMTGLRPASFAGFGLAVRRWKISAFNALVRRRPRNKQNRAP